MNESIEDDVLDVSQFTFTGSFEDQVKELLARVRLTRQEVENLQCLLDDLKQLFGYNWPGSQVHPFGSIVTGLGIKTSDIDCFVQLPPHTMGSPVMNARDLLRRNHKFAQVFAIPAAKVPIVKFVHEPTGFHCDINFTSSNGVRNSKLIAFLLNMDPRALSLAVIIKYWSKVFKFTGTNLMPNYALTMMVIFYLQVKSVLPSVAEIQRNTRPHWVDGWNTAFNDRFAYVPDNSESLYELLGGFFDYYGHFDYTQDVISPYLGCPIKKQVLGDLKAMPSSYSLYKQNVLSGRCEVIRLYSAVCVQDPFEHARNCSGAVFPKLFHRIQAHIGAALKMFHESPNDGFLENLFTSDVPVQAKISQKPKQKLKKINKRNRQVNRNQKAKEYLMHWQMQNGHYNRKFRPFDPPRRPSNLGIKEEKFK